MLVKIYMAMSVNGMIATSHDQTPWSDEEWESFRSEVQSTGNLVIGRKTFEIMESEKEFESLDHPQMVIVSSRDIDGQTVARTPQEALKLLQEKGFSEALIAGGAELNTSFLREKLVDEIIIDFEPHIFNQGKPLFSEIGFDLQLELLETKRLSQNTIQLRYKVI